MVCPNCVCLALYKQEKHFFQCALKYFWINSKQCCVSSEKPSRIYFNMMHWKNGIESVGWWWEGCGKKEQLCAECSWILFQERLNWKFSGVRVKKCFMMWSSKLWHWLSIVGMCREIYMHRLVFRNIMWKHSETGSRIFFPSKSPIVQRAYGVHVE